VELNDVRARCFLEVVERGTVAAAALSLGYTAPAVSQQIGKLERSLGVPLFDRMSGRLRPTPAATALVPHVYAVLDAMESGRLSARTAVGAQGETVVVAAFPSALANLVAPLTGGRCPPLRRAVEAEDDDALRELGLGHVDVAVVQEHSHQRYRRDPRLRYHVLLHDPLDLVLPPGTPAPSSLADAGSLPWVVSGPGSPCRSACEEAWSVAGVSPAVAAEATEVSTLVALVAAGAGVALLPRMALPADLRGARIAAGVSDVVRTLHAVTRRTRSEGAVGEVVDALRAQAALVAAREAERWSPPGGRRADRA
jgi:DNA-binding transcriptional LysR family regulator